MKNKILIIQASARSIGDSNVVVDFMAKSLSADVIDLLNYSIGHYSYEFTNAEDDFIPLIQRITSNYDQIIFVTPIYWYTMSGHLKVFFDRLSDVLSTEKELGRMLRGKTMSYISVSNANDQKNGFDMPFEETANYLGMHYIKGLHAWVISHKLPKQVQDKLLAMCAKFT